jgi:acyl carrier protein
MQNLVQDIMQFVIHKFPLAQKQGISEGDSLIQSGIIDSLGVLEMVNYLIESLDIEISEDDLMPENFESVEAIARFVDRKRKGI